MCVLLLSHMYTLLSLLLCWKIQQLLGHPQGLCMLIVYLEALKFVAYTCAVSVNINQACDSINQNSYHEQRHSWQGRLSVTAVGIALRLTPPLWRICNGLLKVTEHICTSVHLNQWGSFLPPPKLFDMPALIGLKLLYLAGLISLLGALIPCDTRLEQSIVQSWWVARFKFSDIWMVWKLLFF